MAPPRRSIAEPTAPAPEQPVAATLAMGSVPGAPAVPGILLLAIALAALAARAIPVAAGGGLDGLQGYDDGVYFAAATAFTEGVLPYRDFVLLHPPGIVLALTPFALIDATLVEPVGFVLARLAFIGLGAASAVLVAVVAGRHGRAAGIVAGLLYALWAAPVGAERRADLLALENVLLLLGLAVLQQPAGPAQPRRAALAGLLVGFAASVHLWQGLSAAVLLAGLLLARNQGPGRARLVAASWSAGGAAAGLAAVGLPFLALAPEPFIRNVLVDQLGRPDMGIAVMERLRVFEGLPRDATFGGLPPIPDWVVLGAAAAAVALLAGTARRLPWTRPLAALAISQATVVLLAPSFHDDYAAFPAPATALVLGTGLAHAVTRLACRPWLPRLAWASVAVLLVAFGARATLDRTGRAVPVAEVRAAIAGAGCIASDTPALLVQTTAMRRGLANGCLTIVDPTGVFYDLEGDIVSRYRSTEYQQAMVDWFSRSDAGLLTGRGNLTRQTLAEIRRALPFEIEAGPVTILLAEPPP